MNMKKCVYCGQFYDSDRSMICSNCGQENPAVPQGNPAVPQGNPTVPQENPSSGPAIAPGPVITPQHESGESFSDTTQSAAASGVCRVSDYRYSGPSEGTLLVHSIVAGILFLSILVYFSWGLGVILVIRYAKDRVAVGLIILVICTFVGFILASIAQYIVYSISTKILNIDLKKSVSFNLSGDNISVLNSSVKAGIGRIDYPSYVNVNGLSREIKLKYEKPFMSQLSMVDPVAYNKLEHYPFSFVFDVNGRICRLFNDGYNDKKTYLFIDGIKVVDSGVQVVYELPAKNS